MVPAHALVTWHQGLGRSGEPLPPELSLIWGSGKEQTAKPRSAVGTRVCCWGTEACYWSLEEVA